VRDSSAVERSRDGTKKSNGVHGKGRVMVVRGRGGSSTSAIASPKGGIKLKFDGELLGRLIWIPTISPEDR